MDEIAKDVARESAPWREGQSWWVVSIEAIVALVVGIYIVADPVGASDIVRLLLATLLLGASLGQIVDGFQLRGEPISPWAALRGGVGAAVAGLTLFSGWSDYIGPDGARQMLALGLLAYGIIGIVALVLTRGAAGFKVGPLIVDILTIVLGILLLTANAGETGGAQLLGVAAIGGGIALLLYAYSLWNSTRARADRA